MCILLLLFIIAATPSVLLAVFLGLRYGYLGAVPGAVAGLAVGIGIVAVLVKFLRSRQKNKENRGSEKTPGTA